eukprot:TRINITY_DN4465_c0_g2_i1.p2 TRINITY_DN4465_c0_g2~~TRINITY_DN4465_c0_g2_i1.p2  ORF type:complete len:109 (+),score=11.23 TRINITY_DN4465_c0_g2_i1:109-435(+)
MTAQMSTPGLGTGRESEVGRIGIGIRILRPQFDLTIIGTGDYEGKRWMERSQVYATFMTFGNNGMRRGRGEGNRGEGVKADTLAFALSPNPTSPYEQRSKINQDNKTK